MGINSYFFKSLADTGELRQSSFKILNDFGGDDVGIGEVGAVFETAVFESKDIEVEFVTRKKRTP